jgi:hypothetical protein
MFKYILILSAISLISSQVFLETLDNENFEIDTKVLTKEVSLVLEKLQSKLPFEISQECKDEISSLKSIIQVIEDSHGSDEIIFNATKDLVNHFPGLREKCGVPLPTINTDNWSLEKF